MSKKIYIFLLAVISFFLITSNAKAAEFDPAAIISDQEILDSTTMDLADIQSFLENNGSFLAHYYCPNAYGETKSAAQIIFDAARNNYDCDGVAGAENYTTLEQKKAYCKKISINPRFLLVLLQKEQSLITSASPKQTSLDWATGYGCPDGGGCNSRWKGFGKQVNSAALQFYDYIQNPQNYTYKVGNPYTFKNTDKEPMTVTPLTTATAALYNYTPHVYNGNYNFWCLWTKYFTRLYPDDTLVQARGEAGVWLIQDGKKRPFLTKGALTSRFDLNKIITINPADLDKFPTGTAIKFPQYALVKSPRGTVFLIVDDKKRGFTSQEALRKFGANPEEIVEASWDDLNTYEDGAPITATTSYPTGALLQNKKTGGIYFVADGTKAPIWDKIFLKTKFKYKLITKVSPEKLDSYKTVAPVVFNDGELLKSDLSPAVYYIERGTKRPFASGDLFERMGYNWKNVISVPEKIINLYPVGQTIDESCFVLSPDVKEIISTSTDETIGTTTDSTASSTSLLDEIADVINPGN